VHKNLMIFRFESKQCMNIELIQMKIESIWMNYMKIESIQ